MILREEVQLFTKLSGEDGQHTSIARVGGYLDGYKRGKKDKWIPCSERLPEEHDSIFSKFYGTEKWRDAMFRKTSKTVIITVEHRDGTRQTAPCHTIDGEWNQSMKGMGKVIAWMPLPECYGGD